MVTVMMLASHRGSCSGYLPAKKNYSEKAIDRNIELLRSFEKYQTF